jgi:ABC-2 type transport system permease protein
MQKRIGRYIRIWIRGSVLNFSYIATNRFDFVIFVGLKLTRMGFFILFPLALFDQVPTLAGYSRGEVLLLFAVFNIIDVLAQLTWFRGLDTLKYLVRFGELDFVLSKPISPLFYVGFRVIDYFDLLTVPGAIAFLVYAFSQLETPLTGGAILVGIFLFILANIVAFCICLALTSINLYSSEFESGLWLYRHLSNVSRLPPEVFARSVQFFLTFIFPMFVVINFPSRGLLGLLSPALVGWAVVATILWLFFSVWVWRRALRYYTSASS